MHETDPPGEQDDASTPLTEDERKALIPAYITLRHELNEAEQVNILEAAEWAFARKRKILSERFLTDLHKRMFGRVWRWAGKFRRTARNIGVEAYQIPQGLRLLLDDCHYWIENNTYEPDEIATRFHHRLVKRDKTIIVCPFRNGTIGLHALSGSAPKTTPAQH